jgi:16S rRNA (guanine527-N7)-methyltransferase
MDSKTLFSDFQDYATRNIIPSFQSKMRKNFEIYFNELNECNKMFNLISFKDDKDLIYRHFCDCLYSAKAISNILANNATTVSFETLKIADLGTGSGMPGIPVKITFPAIKLTLVESITKKCKFLENVNNKLGFDIEILNKRAEEIGQMPLYRQKYDFVLSRAVSKFSPNLEIAIPLLKVGGYFIVHKTKTSAQSHKEGLCAVENALKYLGAKLERIIPYDIANREFGFCVLVFKKYKDTPMQFPRKAGIPEKKPL